MPFADLANELVEGVFLLEARVKRLDLSTGPARPAAGPAAEEARARRRERDAQRRLAEDADLCERFAAEIICLFPGCPAPRAEAIARHAAARRSGRVGRSAAGRAVDPGAVELAVIASVRHQDTTYDELLMTGVDRADARERVRDDVDGILDHWRLDPPDAARASESDPGG